MCANHPDLNPVALPPQEHHTCYFPGPCLRLGFSSSPCVPKLQPVAPLKIIYHYLSKTFHSLEVLSSMNKHVHQGAFLTQRVLVISIKSILPDSGPPDAVQKPELLAKFLNSKKMSPASKMSTWSLCMVPLLPIPHTGTCILIMEQNLWDESYPRKSRVYYHQIYFLCIYPSYLKWKWIHSLTLLCLGRLRTPRVVRVSVTEEHSGEPLESQE